MVPSDIERLQVILDYPTSSLELIAYRLAAQRKAQGLAAKATGSTKVCTIQTSSIYSGQQLPAIQGTGPGPYETQVQSILSLFDKNGPVLSIDEISGNISLSVEDTSLLIHRYAGKLFFLLGENQEALHFLEVSRWPSSHNCVNQHYWANSIDVRGELSLFRSALSDNETFLRFLRTLHVVYLMGNRLDSYYVPESFNPRFDPTLGPGQIRQPNNSGHCVFPENWGTTYIMLLGRDLNDPFWISQNQPIRDADGLLWGWSGYYWEQHSKSHFKRRHAFHPAQYILRAHLDKMRAASQSCLDAIDNTDKAAGLRSIARLLQSFVCIHPFNCGNMGLIMNIVNWMLRALLGGYLNHLNLDAAAQCLGPTAFEAYFLRVVDTLLIIPNDPISIRRLVSRLASLESAILPISQFDSNDLERWAAENPRKLSIVELKSFDETS
jgi:hypothetical protein